MTIGKGRHGNRRSSIKNLRIALYGSKDFDKEIYTQAFKNHIMNVMQLFTEKNKLDQLLIHSFIYEPNWTKLCKFLDLPKPEKKFPHLNKGKYEGV